MLFHTAKKNLFKRRSSLRSFSKRYLLQNDNSNFSNNIKHLREDFFFTQFFLSKIFLFFYAIPSYIKKCANNNKFCIKKYIYLSSIQDAKKFINKSKRNKNKNNENFLQNLSLDSEVFLVFSITYHIKVNEICTH